MGWQLAAEQLVLVQLAAGTLSIFPAAVAALVLSECRDFSLI